MPGFEVSDAIKRFLATRRPNVTECPVNAKSWLCCYARDRLEELRRDDGRLTTHEYYLVSSRMEVADILAPIVNFSATLLPDQQEYVSRRIEAVADSDTKDVRDDRLHALVIFINTCDGSEPNHH